MAVGATAIGMVCDKETAGKLQAELFKWYKKAEFPSYQPEKLNLPTSVADSLLCSDSVGKFMEVSKFEYASAERKSRCAAVAAEVTKKVVELLNTQFA